MFFYITYKLLSPNPGTCPKELPGDLTNTTGKKNGVLLHLKKMIITTGNVVVLERGFCVLQGLIDLIKVGFFTVAATNKR